MIIPSEKVAKRLADSESARAQGEAALAAFKQVADSVVLHNEEDLYETPMHEKTETPVERVVEYGSAKGGAL